MIAQFDPDTGKIRHLLTLEQWPQELYLELFNRAQNFLDPATKRAKRGDELNDKTVVNAFFEPSTRTRLSFEIAAKRLGADVINFDVENSATSKGESMTDTLRVLECLGADLINIRHGGNLLDELSNLGDHNVAFCNAGDGKHAHPSQALLDVWTVLQERGTLDNLQVAIIGDIKHSRVARSLAVAFNAFGAEVRVAGPLDFLPSDEEMNSLGMMRTNNLDEALADVDVVVCLRIQLERGEDTPVGLRHPSEESYNYNIEQLRKNTEYTTDFRVDEKRLKLASTDVLVLHPGPMNREMEITSAVADGPQSRVFQQAANGVAMRMAIMTKLLED